MRAPDEVAATPQLKQLGWGIKRIAREFGCIHMTVRRYIALDDFGAFRHPTRPNQLGDLDAWCHSPCSRQALSRIHQQTTSKTLHRQLEIDVSHPRQRN